MALEMKALSSRADEWIREDPVPPPLVLGANRLGRYLFTAAAPGSYQENLGNQRTAALTGTLVHPRDKEKRFDLHLAFSGFERKSPPLPKAENKRNLKPEAYKTFSAEGGPLNLLNWWFYARLDKGLLRGRGKYEGAQIELTLRGPSVQIGPGANNKNVAFGAALWIFYETLKQPNDRSFKLPNPADKEQRIGDINIHLERPIHTIGFWQNVCTGRAQSGDHEIERESLAIYAQLIAEKFRTFAGVGGADEMCELLNARPGGSGGSPQCTQAQRQFIGVLLNLYSGRLSVTSTVNLSKVPGASSNLGVKTIWQVAKLLDDLIAGEDKGDCEEAIAIATAINEIDSGGAKILVERVAKA